MQRRCGVQRYARIVAHVRSKFLKIPSKRNKEMLRSTFCFLPLSKWWIKPVERKWLIEKSFDNDVTSTSVLVWFSVLIIVTSREHTTCLTYLSTRTTCGYNNPYIKYMTIRIRHASLPHSILSLRYIKIDAIIDEILKLFEVSYETVSGLNKPAAILHRPVTI